MFKKKKNQKAMKQLLAALINSFELNVFKDFLLKWQVPISAFSRYHTNTPQKTKRKTGQYTRKQLFKASE